MSRFDDEWRLLIESRLWLQSRGYRLFDSRGPEGMNQGFDAHAGTMCSIRITADRGQWFVEIRPGASHQSAKGSEHWFNLEVWSRCLGHPLLFHEDPTGTTDKEVGHSLNNSWWLEPQLRFLRDRLSEIESACSTEQLTSTIECLRTARRALSPFAPRG
jgi:hypothetical protein